MSKTIPAKLILENVFKGVPASSCIYIKETQLPCSLFCATLLSFEIQKQSFNYLQKWKWFENR